MFRVSFVRFSFCEFRESVFIQVVNLANFLFSLVLFYLAKELCIKLECLLQNLLWNYLRVRVNLFCVIFLVSVDGHLFLVVVDGMVDVDKPVGRPPA